MFLLIDNYDSFTYNLVQAFYSLGRKPVVIKNTDSRLLELATAPELEMVCISPGPGTPLNTGYCLDFLAKLSPSIPVLGVCLGHQVLGHFAGAEVVVAKETMHGKQSEITHDGSGLFYGLPNPMTVGRYHSLVVLADQQPERLRVTARTDKGHVMAMQYADRPWVGVQFHPESVLTPDGVALLKNFPEAVIQNKTAQPVQQGKEEFAGAPVQLPVILEAIAAGRDLTEEEANAAFSRLMEGELSASQAGALLIGLRSKGETPLEVGAAAKAVIQKAVKIPPYKGKTIDIVGTGGDSKGSFNCSTATALTLAAMGYKVLKHGNRSVSSRCGSADVLEKLGVPLDLRPEEVAKQLDERNFAFLFAPQYHPAFKYVVPIRRELGIRTLFNILGPLVNPAMPTHHFLGVANTSQLDIVAQTLLRNERQTISGIVHGAGGYDELTTLGEADIIFVVNETIRPARLNPATYGFKPYPEEDLTVADPEEACEVLKHLLQGQGPQAMLEMLALNVGFGVYLLDLDPATENIDAQLGYDPNLMRQAMEKGKNAVFGGAGKVFA